MHQVRAAGRGHRQHLHALQLSVRDHRRSGKQEAGWVTSPLNQRVEGNTLRTKGSAYFAFVECTGCLPWAAGSAACDYAFSTSITLQSTLQSTAICIDLFIFCGGWLHRDVMHLALLQSFLQSTTLCIELVCKGLGVGWMGREAPCSAHVHAVYWRENVNVTPQYFLFCDGKMTGTSWMAASCSAHVLCRCAGALHSTRRCCILL